jgi:hypothetical protein
MVFLQSLPGRIFKATCRTPRRNLISDLYPQPTWTTGAYSTASVSILLGQSIYLSMMHSQLIQICSPNSKYVSQSTEHTLWQAIPAKGGCYVLPRVRTTECEEDSVRRGLELASRFYGNATHQRDVPVDEIGVVHPRGIPCTREPGVLHDTSRSIDKIDGIIPENLVDAFKIETVQADVVGEKERTTRISAQYDAILHKNL